MAGSPTPEKRKRQVHPKTRTGCKTCKIRKVKCDEMKPFCKRCTSTGRTCDGYPSVQPIQAHFLAPRSRSSTPLALTQQMNISIPGSPAEKRGFHFFVTHTANELSGYFNEEFWNVFVLRGCYDQGALRHAVVGIGALHEDFEHEGGAEEKERFAVDQYLKAITHLRQSLNQSNPNESPLTALISCVLFVCFDSLRGSFHSAMLHLKSGLRILKEIRAQIKSKSKRNGRVISKEEELVVEKYIAPLFVRLIVQTILYCDTRTGREKAILARELSVEDSDYNEAGVFNQELLAGWKFENLEEAREKLNSAAGGLFRMFYICDPAKAMAFQPAIVHNLLMIHTSALAAWNTAFNIFMSTHTSSLSTKQIRGAALLKIHHTTLEIMRRSAPAMSDPRPISEAANSAKTFRTAIPLFVSIVALCKSLITALEQDALKTGNDAGMGKTFSPDLGVVGPLYYVGTKCTVKEVRDEALALLGRRKGREGMWDSGVGSQLVSEFWDMEKRFGTRGYGEVSNDGTEEVEEVSWFTQALRSDRVRLDLVNGRKWVWKYKRNGNVDDGVFEEDGVAAASTEYDDEDGGEWVSLGGSDERINEQWVWGDPVPNYDIGGFGMNMDMDMDMGLGSVNNSNNNTSPTPSSLFHHSQSNTLMPPLPEDWMGGDISAILQDPGTTTESWSMPQSLQAFDLAGLHLDTAAFVGPGGLL